MDSRIGTSPSPGSRFLPDLRASHLELDRLMEEIYRTAREPVVDDVRLSAARWKLSQARRQNRMLVDAILAGLPAEVKADLAHPIAELQVLVNDALFATARHSARWNPRAVNEDPKAYLVAIRQIRECWLRTIEAEHKLFYPLLDPRQAAAA